MDAQKFGEKNEKKAGESASPIYERAEQPTGNSPDSPNGHSGPGSEL